METDEEVVQKIERMEELEEGELEEEPSLAYASDWGEQPSNSDQTKLRQETHREGLEEGELPDEKGDGNLSDISDNEGVWDRRSQSTVQEGEQKCLSKTCDSRLRQSAKSDTSSIPRRKAEKSAGKGKLLKKWFHSQSGFHEDKDQWTYGPEEMILWHGRKVSAGKAASGLPEELFLAFEGDLDVLLQLSSFGGIRCDKLMDDYKEKLPSSAKEFKRIARMNNCSSTALVKICLSNLREKYEVFPMRCWNADGEQSSDTAVIQRKMRKCQEGSAEEKRECSNKEVMVIASNVTGRVKWFDVNSGHGFVTRDDNKEDVLVHRTALINNTPVQSLGVGEVLTFDVVIREKRIEASNVSSRDHRSVQEKKMEGGVERKVNSRKRQLSAELDRELAAEIEIIEKKIKTEDKDSRENEKKRKRKSRQRRSQSGESEVEDEQKDGERSRSTKGEESSCGKSHRGRIKRRKGSGEERSRSKSSSRSGSCRKKRRRSSSSEQRKRSSKERESGASCKRRKSKRRKRLREDKGKKRSQQHQGKDKCPNKKKGALVTDAAILRILRVSLLRFTFLQTKRNLSVLLYI